jgi:SOS response regulatory protein OraA/RecX
MVNSILDDEILEPWESLLFAKFVQKQIDKYKLKWKSRFYIRWKLIERKEDKNLVEELLEKNFKDWEFDQVKMEYDKISWRCNDKKIIERLLRKWFNYNDIKIVCEK